MKNEVVGLNHLETVKLMLQKSINLLNNGRDIYPFSKWRDGMTDLIEEIQEYIAEEQE